MTKIRSKKKNVIAQKSTLDQKHNEKLQRFEKLNNSLPSKQEKITRLEEELSTLTSMNPNKYTHENIRRKSYLKDAIQKLRKEINAIENCTESLSYISNTLPFLVDYYDNNNIADDDDDNEPEEINSETNDNGKKNIISYFKKETPINRKKISDKTFGSKTTRPRLSRAKIYDGYQSVLDPNYQKRKERKTKCPDPKCDGERNINQNDGYLVCTKCGLSDPILVVTNKPSYKEPAQDNGTYAYKRINHLTEILSQLQAKESTDIPPRIFESIRRELKKRKIPENDLDIFRLRRILKKLAYRKYYEHVPHILQIINGKKPPNFSRKDEIRIKKMFRDIQKPFAIFCPQNRKNFLNYSYVLHKFCELLGLDEYISYFPLLKNNTKLLQHDKIWKNICGFVRWKFYRSL